MSTEENLDEQAIRDKLEQALEKMDSAPTDPDPDQQRSSADDGSRGSYGGDPHLHYGTITSIAGKDVYVELGPRSQGVISIDEFEEPPTPGQSFEFSLVSIQDNLWTLSRREARALATWKELARGKTVKATVIGENSGGLELKVGPVSAFMPASEIAMYRIDDLTSLVGETMVCEVMEVSRRRKRVVLSRKAVLFRERRESRERTLADLAEGQVVRGKVEKIESFGAFVDIGGGVTGLLHVSNISHKRVDDPSKVLEVGQDVEVQILELKNGGKRIGLGMKQLATDPWESLRGRLRPGQVVKGKVIRITDFGAFVEIEDAVEGLLHKSQLSSDRVNRVEDVVKTDEEVMVRIISLDVDSRRISLSRLNEGGSLLGSDDDLANDELNQYIDSGSAPKFGTNLGDLLRAAMEKKQKESS